MGEKQNLKTILLVNIANPFLSGFFNGQSETNRGE